MQYECAIIIWKMDHGRKAFIQKKMKIVRTFLMCSKSGKVEKKKLNCRSGNKNEHNHMRELIEWQQYVWVTLAKDHCQWATRRKAKKKKELLTKYEYSSTQVHRRLFVISIYWSVYFRIARNVLVHVDVFDEMLLLHLLKWFSSKFTLRDFDYRRFTTNFMNNPAIVSFRMAISMCFNQPTFITFVIYLHN